MTAREFDEFFEDLLRSGERFFILRGNHLEAVSSAGIGSLVKFVRRLRGLGGGAVFVRLPEEIRLLLEFFGLGELLPVFDTVEGARESLESSLVRFQDSLEIKRESTVRTRVRPNRNQTVQSQQAVAVRRTTHAVDPDVYARPLESDAADGELHGPTDSELEVAAGSGPTESEMEVMAAAGPTESEMEVMAAVGPTESEREVMAAAGRTEPAPAERTQAAAIGQRARPTPLAEYPEVQYEQAILEDQIARENDLAADSDTDLDELAVSNPGEHEYRSESRVMACNQCGLNLRIFKSGLHMCPACGIEFDVRR